MPTPDLDVDVLVSNDCAEIKSIYTTYFNTQVAELETYLVSLRALIQDITYRMKYYSDPDHPCYNVAVAKDYGDLLAKCMALYAQVERQQAQIGHILVLLGELDCSSGEGLGVPGFLDVKQAIRDYLIGTKTASASHISWLYRVAKKILEEVGDSCIGKLRPPNIYTPVTLDDPSCMAQKRMREDAFFGERGWAERYEHVTNALENYAETADLGGGQGTNECRTSWIALHVAIRARLATWNNLANKQYRKCLDALAAVDCSVNGWEAKLATYDTQLGILKGLISDYKTHAETHRSSVISLQDTCPVAGRPRPPTVDDSSKSPAIGPVKGGVGPIRVIPKSR